MPSDQLDAQQPGQPINSSDDIARTLADIRQRIATPLSTQPGDSEGPIHRPKASTPVPDTLKIRLVTIIAGLIALAIFFQFSHQKGTAPRRSISPDSVAQKEAEALLQALDNGDASAGDQILEKAPVWVGKTRVTPRTDQLLTTALNLHELHAREAALEAELALNGIPKNENGLKILTDSVGNPGSQAWALWLLGALGNRGVDPVHTAKILGGYLLDPDVNVRASAVNGLALLGTNETIPMLLDRFRNDPSPVVQERAACGIAESGMYTKEQRMNAAQSLISWLDDPLLTGQQRSWDVQALGDITGQHFGTNSVQWREWYANQS